MRRDCTERHMAGFEIQMEDIVDAYMSWSTVVGEVGLDSGCPEPPEDQVQGTYRIQVLDMFDESSPFLLETF
jgi:hypothetical protein